MPGERKRKTMLPLKVSVTLSLDEPVLRGICRCAERENRSVSGYVTITLRRHIHKVESGEIGAEELELAVERNRGKKRNKTLSISGDVLEKMRLYAELDARSLSQYINLVLKRHLAEIKKAVKAFIKKSRSALFYLASAPRSDYKIWGEAHDEKPPLPFYTDSLWGGFWKAMRSLPSAMWMTPQ